MICKPTMPVPAMTMATRASRIRTPKIFGEIRTLPKEMRRLPKDTVLFLSFLDNVRPPAPCWVQPGHRSEEHTSELQSLMRISYAVFCLKKNNTYHKTTYIISTQTKHA